MNPMHPRLQQSLQRALGRWQAFAPCAGTNVTLIDASRGNWNGASGYADVDSMAPMAAGASCYIYSITKTFIAVAVLQLAERGRLSLDDPIVRHLAGLALPETVTIRRLLNHTAGVPSYTDLPAYPPAVRAQPSAPWTYEQVAAATCAGPLDFSPGEGWRYSNTGYMLLHRLIETVTQRRFADAIRSSIIEPLGLGHTYAAEEVDCGQLTPGYCAYLNDSNAMENVVRRYRPGWCLTGLIASTSEEIAVFYQALFGGRLVSAASLGQMTTWTSCNPGGGPGQAAPPFFRDPGYGLGLMIDPQWGYGGLYGHGGDGPGFNTWAMVLPDFHGGPLVLAIACNTSMSTPPFQLTSDLIRVLESG